MNAGIVLLPDAEATQRLGAAMASALAPGDALCLAGELGAGKSALARAVIAALLAEDGRAEDIPSPTYTLVQTYQTARGEALHADLYRLSAPEEADELGLLEAEAAIRLIEWPERLSDRAPARRLDIRLAIPNGGIGREAEIRPRGPGWEALLAAVDAIGLDSVQAGPATP